jgi:IS30 family transposase
VPARILPDRSELEKMLRSGMTHAEIAREVSRATGHPVKRSTVSAAIHRAGISQPAKKYPEEIPWTVREEHLTHYAARMLRTLGRRRKGIANSAEMDARLDAWLELLSSNHSVVAYVPETPQGFFYVDGEPNELGIPIITDLKF